MGADCGYEQTEYKGMRWRWSEVHTTALHIHVCNANTDTQALSHSYLELKGVGDLGPRNVIQEQNEQKTMKKKKN